MKTNYRDLPERLKDLKYYAGLSLASIAVFISTLFVLLPETKTERSLGSKNQVESNVLPIPTAVKCEAVDWAVWKSFENKTASGTIINQGKSVGVTMTSDDDFKPTTRIEHYLAFKRFDHAAPNGLVPRTSWSKQQGGVTTICFSEAVKDPVMLLASLGSVDVMVKTTLYFSEAYVMMFNVAGMRMDNNKTLTGKEGYAILKFPGEVKCIMIKSTNNDDFTDITMGISACIESGKAPDPVVIAAVSKSVPEPIVGTPKPAMVIAAVVKPIPAPKPVVEAPKPAAVVAVEMKPIPVPKPTVELPKPIPVAVVIKPIPAPKPVVEMPKPAPVVTTIVKPELTPKPVVVTPMQAPITAAVVKPVPVPEPVVEQPKPILVAVVDKPIPVAKPVIEQPRPIPVAIAVKAIPVPKPVVEMPKPAPVVAAVVKLAPAQKSVVEQPKPAPVIAVVLPKPASVVKSKVIPPVIVPTTKPAKIVTVATNQNDLVKSKIVRIEVWDYSGLDHDSISLKLNGKQIGPKSIELPAYSLYGSPKFTFQMELGDGENVLEIYAVSAGFEGTATVGMLIMYEDRRKKSAVSLNANETAYIQL